MPWSKTVYIHSELNGRNEELNANFKAAKNVLSWWGIYDRGKQKRSIIDRKMFEEVLRMRDILIKLQKDDNRRKTKVKSQYVSGRQVSQFFKVSLSSGCDILLSFVRWLFNNLLELCNFLHSHFSFSRWDSSALHFAETNWFS